LTLREDTDKVVRRLWFVQWNFDNLWMDRRFVRRAESIKDILKEVSGYMSKREELPFPRRLVYDNLFGAIERYLLSFGQWSIFCPHLQWNLRFSTR
jgi:hypothetical protein